MFMLSCLFNGFSSNQRVCYHNEIVNFDGFVDKTNFNRIDNSFTMITLISAQLCAVVVCTCVFLLRSLNNNVCLCERKKLQSLLMNVLHFILFFFHTTNRNYSSFLHRFHGLFTFNCSFITLGYTKSVGPQVCDEKDHRIKL